jgi:hypothetical protein
MTSPVEIRASSGLREPLPPSGDGVMEPDSVLARPAILFEASRRLQACRWCKDEDAEFLYRSGWVCARNACLLLAGDPEGSVG